MKAGEVWALRCVGMICYTLVLRKLDVGFDFLNLDTGHVQRWHTEPRFGDRVGEWKLI